MAAGLERDTTAPVRRTVLEFRSEPGAARALGGLMGCFGSLALLASIAFADEDVPLLLFGIGGAALVAAGVVAWSFRHSVRLDRHAGQVEKTIETRMWKRVERHPLGRFHGVGIGMAGDGGSYKSGTRYLLQLLGPRNVNLPGTTADKDRILELAQQVGEYLGLPVDAEPRMVFFRSRL